MPFPETLNAKPKVIFFTDFDGTITLQDTNDYVTDHYGMGYEKRKAGGDAILEGKQVFRNHFQNMIDSWNMPFPRVLEILSSTIELDPAFRDFMVYAREHKIPVIVLSSGMVPVIETLLKQLLGPELSSDIEIVANKVKVVAPGHSLDAPDGWDIDYHDDSHFGHDKSLTIRPYAKAIAEMPESQRPTLLYAGDGVSDLSAARETDLLFAKAGHDLIIYCEKEGIPFTTFEDWSSILQETRDINEGKKSVKKVAEEGLQRHRTNSMSNQDMNGSAKPSLK